MPETVGAKRKCKIFVRRKYIAYRGEELMYEL